jgi:hypothetical protein
MRRMYQYLAGSSFAGKSTLKIVAGNNDLALQGNEWLSDSLPPFNSHH